MSEMAVAADVAPWGIKTTTFPAVKATPSACWRETSKDARVAHVALLLVEGAIPDVAQEDITRTLPNTIKIALVPRGFKL